MIDDRFSLPSFERVRDNPDALRALADDLQLEITQELQNCMLPKFLELVSKLNQLGHNLREYEDIQIDHVHYRDDVIETGEYDCKLRLAATLVVGAGYADVRFSRSRPS